MDLNQVYFDTLFEKFLKNEQVTLVLHQPEKNINSNVICIPIASEEDLEAIEIKNYEELNLVNTEACSKFEYTLIKMQAGLGSSVLRSDLIQKIEKRTELGAKGTDLYFKINNEFNSISAIQLLQANALSEKKIYKKINYKNLVNDETKEAVTKSIEKVILGPLCELQAEYFQRKMPTIDEGGELTTERMAPAGHGFIGYCEILDTFNSPLSHEVVAIGNGEDLSSTPDEKIVSWVIENNIPITMLTTTKTSLDKKGGQISIVKGEQDYITIVEKAQAEVSGQLEYFESLGLRDGDKESLFNTNIVLINKKALKEKFNEYLPQLDSLSFIKQFSPDVIQNIKTQNDKSYIQLESALGSVVLNLDKYFRLSHGTALVSFLNLDESNRRRFFMPIKKREDYDLLFDKYEIDETSFQLILK
jgi:hypothetical protein